MNILLIEDSKRLCRSLERGLDYLGYEVRVENDGLRGLEAARTLEPDLILLDLLLPGMGGLEILRQLRAEGRKTLVLILSARDATEQRIKGLEAGADDYLVKPFSMQELLARIDALLRGTPRDTSSRARLRPGWSKSGSVAQGASSLGIA